MERVPFAATEASRVYDAVGQLPAAMLLDHVRSMYNVGSFFRTADAVGIERLFLCGITAQPPKAEISKTALGAEGTVAWEYHVDALTAIRLLRARGYSITAIETNSKSVDLFDWRPVFPVAVIFGNEVDGLGNAILDACDEFVQLPMRGRKHSVNVATAAGVVAYELLRKYRKLREGDAE